MLARPKRDEVEHADGPRPQRQSFCATTHKVPHAQADCLEGVDLRCAALLRADLAGANLRGRISRALTFTAGWAGG
jgi:hypothetical protein